VRNERQLKILELISEFDIETQDELAGLLIKSGIKVTQATVSRDIKDMKLIKTLGSNGKYKYTINKSDSDMSSSDNFFGILKDIVISAVCANNITVVKTRSGYAGAACEAIDSLEIKEILGTIAGDNTIFIATASEHDSQIITDFINKKIKAGENI